MSIGFIPSNDNDMGEHTQLNAASNEWLAWQVAEAWNAHEALFREVDRYCEHLELLDPDRNSAAQAKAEVRLRMSRAATIHERMEILTNEAQRLRREVAKAKRQWAANVRSTTFLSRAKSIVFLIGLAVVVAAWPTGIF
jgi:hypothetical protein